MSNPSLLTRIRQKIAEWLFLAAGRLDSAYDVWLDDAPRRHS
jgi:hypothetical protein